MLLVQSLIAAMLAWMAGTLMVVGLVLGGLLAIYAIYWIIFKMGKD